jgi:type IX secretion system PorP/SprF family membrane protein
MKKHIQYYFWGLLSLLLAIFSNMRAQQDSHISQFNNSPMMINPAATGAFPGDYRVFLDYRTQWAAILKNPFINQVAAFDMPYNKFGFGLVASSDQEGSGNLASTGMALSCSYEVTSDPAEIHHLTTGVQVGFINQSIDLSRLTFDNQYSYANGGGFDQNLSSQEPFKATSFTIPDLNYGLFYYYKNKRKKVNPYLGISAFHLTMPKESFFGADYRLPIRVLLNGGAKIKLDEYFRLEPSFIVQQQAGVREINFGALGDYYLLEENTHFQLGLFYRWQDAFIIQTGLVYREYMIHVSYDVNASYLAAFSQSRGAFEISVSYTREKARYVPSF